MNSGLFVCSGFSRKNWATSNPSQKSHFSRSMVSCQGWHPPVTPATIYFPDQCWIGIQIYDRFCRAEQHSTFSPTNCAASRFFLSLFGFRLLRLWSFIIKYTPYWNDKQWHTYVAQCTINWNYRCRVTEIISSPIYISCVRLLLRLGQLVNHPVQYGFSILCIQMSSYRWYPVRFPLRNCCRWHIVRQKIGETAYSLYIHSILTN